MRRSTVRTALVLTPGVSLVLALMPAAVAVADTIESTGAVDAVTIFRGQALVSRLVDLSGPVGLREVIVTELPEFIIPASLYAESSDGVEVRSVSYRVRPLAQDARENVRALDIKIQEVTDRIDAVTTQQAFIQWQEQYLGKLENFLTVTAQIENSRGVLNAETVGTMTELLFSRRLKQSDDGRTLSLESRALNDQLTLLRRERDQITVRTSRSAREAVVFINQTVPSTRLRLNYLVDRASWTPSYNLRADTETIKAGPSGEVALEYQASIQQMSGEDWTNVRITLSTATPALVSSAPPLDALVIALAAPATKGGGMGGGGGGGGAGGYADAKKELALRQRVAEDNRNMMTPSQERSQLEAETGLAADGNRPDGQVAQQGQLAFSAQALGDQHSAWNDLSLNSVAAESQLLDVSTREKFDRRDKSAATVQETVVSETVSVTYAIASRTSVPSRSDQQLIQIARVNAPGVFYKVATPVLTGAIFDEATVTNSSDMVLLAGPSASYAGGEFVGRGTIPTVAVGQTFTVGFGIDTALRATRELVERTESTQGGNRVVDFVYRINIENFSKLPVAVRLMDRLPNPKGSDIKLTLVSSGTETQQLSTDPTYERSQRKNGILRWDLTVPASRGAADPFTLEYRFKLEYDRQMAITSAPA